MGGPARRRPPFALAAERNRCQAGWMSGDDERGGVPLTNLDQPLFGEAEATKRDLVDYLDAVRDQILPVLADRPLSVIRALPGQAPFMQKNVPKYTPSWVQTVTVWAEASKREVSYALCNDRRTLLWFANQRAVEYHPGLVRAGRMGPSDPPHTRHRPAVRATRSAWRSARRTWSAQALADVGLAGAVKTSGAKGVHVFVPIDGAVTATTSAAATRAIAARAERWIRRSPRPRSSGTTVKARCSSTPPGPAGRPSWRRTARASGRACRCRSPWPGTSSIASRRRLHGAHALVSRRRDPWADQMPAPQPLSADWSTKGTRSRSPGSRPCTRASAGPAPAAPDASAEPRTRPNGTRRPASPTSFS